MRLYYIHNGDVKKGPFDFEHLREQSITKETSVWFEGLEDWIKAGNVGELQQLFTTSSTPPPLPKNLNAKISPRVSIIDSFAEAEEIMPEPQKHSLFFPIIITIIIIVGIIYTILHYR